VTKPRMETDVRRPIPNPSSSRAMAGWSIESELVTAARKRREKKRKPTSWPRGIEAKTMGRVMKPRLKTDFVASAVPAGPRKMKAAGTMIIPAKMSIEDFNQLVGADLPEEEYDTMGGLVFGLFGRLPSPGAKVSYMLYTFTVEKMMGTRIQELRIEWNRQEAARPEGEGPDTGPQQAEGNKN